MIELLSLAFISLLGAMSPGPDFAIVTKYILTGSRNAAFHAALGISLALLVHVTYCALGVALVLFEFPLIFSILQIAGSCYLGYLGACLLLPSKQNLTNYVPKSSQSLRTGFFSSLLNPKTTLFMFGIFTQFAGPQTPWPTFILYALIISGVTLLWFCCLIFLMTLPYFKQHFDRWRDLLMKGMGLLLISLAITVFVRALF